jgi:CHAT domain-containing protein
LLQYSIGEERSYLWAITPTSFSSYKLPGRKEIEIAVGKFQGISNPTGVPSKVIEDAKSFSKILLAPVADKIVGKRLVIVPDGALQTIPFAALPDLNPTQIKNVETQNFASLQSPYQPLIINHEIVNLPSATTIAIQRRKIAKRHKSPQKTLAILADPVYSATDVRVTGKPESNQLAPEIQQNSAPQAKSTKSQLTPELEIERSILERSAKNLNRNGWFRLPNTEVEAEAILKIFQLLKIPSTNSLQALNFEATYNWATNPALSQFRILHFATHGFVDNENPENSGIVLSLVDKKGNPIRGHLRLADIFEQDYPAELIVLSACQTGLGKNVNGEGLVGLTRGLMYAGASRVAVSLWNVNDEGTSVLMREFYTEMLQGNKTPAAAMRAAQIKLWRNSKWQNPYYWAAFTVSGEWR